MKVLVVFAGLFAFVASQRPYEDDIPIPYSFKYTAEGEEGTSAHEETSDASGRKVGFYYFTDLDGNSRRVEYTADEDGFKAIVRTNEPGTVSQNPANVIIESSAAGTILTSSGPSDQSRPRPASPPVAPSTESRRPGGIAYVLVPISESGDFQ